MFEEKRLDFGGCDREPFVLDHLFAAVEYVVEAVGIAAHDVAGEIPAITKSSGGGLGLLPISEHDLRAAHDEFAGLALSELFSVGVHDAAVGEGHRLSDRGRGSSFSVAGGTGRGSEEMPGSRGLLVCP